jgi:hypothetical protein
VPNGLRAIITALRNRKCASIAASPAILQAANAAVDKRMAEREAIRPLMPLYPGFTWAQIHRGLTVSAVSNTKALGEAFPPARTSL